MATGKSAGKAAPGRARKATAPKKKRVRRSAEDAQVHILDAAEAIMAKGGGPAALRLADVARQANVSHPAILHHFGSREGLVQAINKRAFERLSHQAMNQMSSDRPGNDGLKATFAAYRDGLAQRMVWLMQSGEPQSPARPGFFEQVVESFHQMRKRFAQAGAEPDPRDSRAVIHLTTLAAFGDALIGPRLRNAGPREEEEREAFERWFGELLELYLRSKAVKAK